ncbi:hypothetical protein PAXRUDRAFT_21045 [Paxillus rubicundulus Ve08.2h10]|uniref:Uncharacterized protein n=1 Tax=Paxillus rubicundulus Ve08.2h10 TaxID=930991 RepID=A0A0D0CCP4_9AGAM|nr:hypothetical protein PAXRUDRAFT_21045 [Paxillus rubicundulus Ve08.2h10]
MELIRSSVSPPRPPVKKSVKTHNFVVGTTTATPVSGLLLGWTKGVSSTSKTLGHSLSQREYPHPSTEIPTDNKSVFNVCSCAGLGDDADTYNPVAHSSPPQLSIWKLSTPGYNATQPVNASNVTARAGHQGIRDQRQGFGGKGEHQDKEEGRHGGSDRVDNEAVRVDEGQRRQRGDDDSEGKGEGDSAMHGLDDDSKDEGDSARLGGGGVDYNNETKPNNVPRKPAASDSMDNGNGGGNGDNNGDDDDGNLPSMYNDIHNEEGDEDGVTKDSKDSDTKGSEDDEPEVDETGENESEEDRPRPSGKSFKEKGKPRKVTPCQGRLETILA